MDMIPTSVTLREDQRKWLFDRCINLSMYVRKRIDEDMKKQCDVGLNPESE